MQSDRDEHRQLFDLIEKMLDYDPARRITMSEGMRHPFFSKLSPEQRGSVQAGPSSEDRERSHSLSR